MTNIKEGKREFIFKNVLIGIGIGLLISVVMFIIITEHQNHLDNKDYVATVTPCNYGCAKMLEVEYGTYSEQEVKEYNAHFFVCKQLCEKEFEK